jgi:hypothetical protein
MTTTENNPVIDNFIFEMTIITPLNDIITKLENREFRDCDINWLNDKLNKYTELALEVLGRKINLGKVVDGIMNDNNRERFLSYFNTLLKFFKSY